MKVLTLKKMPENHQVSTIHSEVNMNICTKSHCNPLNLYSLKTINRNLNVALDVKSEDHKRQRIHPVGAQILRGFTKQLRYFQTDITDNRVKKGRQILKNTKGKTTVFLWRTGNMLLWVSHCLPAQTHTSIFMSDLKTFATSLKIKVIKLCN